jgi:hypothetical protein
MNVEGITWHAVVLEAEAFAATRKLLSETMRRASRRRQLHRAVELPLAPFPRA